MWMIWLSMNTTLGPTWCGMNMPKVIIATASAVQAGSTLRLTTLLSSAEADSRKVWLLFHKKRARVHLMNAWTLTKALTAFVR